MAAKDYKICQTAGRKLSQISIDLLSLAKSDVPSGKFLPNTCTRYQYSSFYRQVGTNRDLLVISIGRQIYVTPSVMVKSYSKIWR